MYVCVKQTTKKQTEKTSKAMNHATSDVRVTLYYHNSSSLF